MQYSVEHEGRAGGTASHGGDSGSLDYRLFYEQLPGSSLVLKRDLTVVAASDDYLRVSGQSREQLLGRCIFDVSLAEPDTAYGAELRASLARVLHERCPHVMSTTTYQGTQREARSLQPSNLPLLGSDGQVLFVIHRLDDVSELQQARAEAEGASRELAAFCYAVAHDLRAPLRAIDGFSQALIEDYAQVVDEGGKQLLARLRRGAQRMAQLIDDLLALSRASRSPLAREPVDLTAMACASLERLREQAPSRQVELSIAPGMSVNGDPSLLSAALHSLLGNAWKFTGQKARARIEVGSTDRQGQRVYYVRDNGVGFDMAYADKLFGPFERLHGQHEFEGTGMGLATVQRIVKRHGGHIWPESTPGEGACFFFTLPG